MAPENSSSTKISNCEQLGFDARNNFYFSSQSYWEMELLRAYQLRKKLGLVQTVPESEYFDSCDVQQQILAMYKEVLCAAQREKPMNMIAQSRVQSPSNRNRVGSPRHSLRITQQADHSTDELRQIIEALELRIDDLEARNDGLSQSTTSHNATLAFLQNELGRVTAERDHLSTQVASLRSVVSSESSAGRVLERVSHNENSGLEFKLEIYKQQVLMLNQELDKLRSNKS